MCCVLLICTRGAARVQSHGAVAWRATHHLHVLLPLHPVRHAPSGPHYHIYTFYFSRTIATSLSPTVSTKMQVMTSSHDAMRSHFAAKNMPPASAVVQKHVPKELCSDIPSWKVGWVVWVWCDACAWAMALIQEHTQLCLHSFSFNGPGLRIQCSMQMHKTCFTAARTLPINNLFYASLPASPLQRLKAAGWKKQPMNMIKCRTKIPTTSNRACQFEVSKFCWQRTIHDLPVVKAPARPSCT